MESTPIVTVIKCLETGKPPPFEWVIEHASDGTLTDVWQLAKRADYMFFVYAMTHTASSALLESTSDPMDTVTARYARFCCMRLPTG